MFWYGLPELGSPGGCFALFFHCLHHLIQANDLFCSPWTCMIISNLRVTSHGGGHTGAAHITGHQVPLKLVATCRNRLFQSIADLHPGQLLIDESRWPSVGLAIPMFHSYLQLQSWVFSRGPGSLVTKGLVQKLGMVSYWTNVPSWNPACYDGLGFRQSDWDIITVTHQYFPRIPPDEPCLVQDLPDLPHWCQLPIRCHKEYSRWLCTHLLFDIDGAPHARILFPQECIHLLDMVFLLGDSVTRCTHRRHYTPYVLKSLPDHHFIASFSACSSAMLFVFPTVFMLWYSCFLISMWLSYYYYLVWCVQ